MLLSANMDLTSVKQFEAVRALILGQSGYLCCMYESIASLAEHVSAFAPEFHRRKGNNDNISDKDLCTNVFSMTSIRERDQKIYRFNPRE